MFQTFKKPLGLSAGQLPIGFFFGNSRLDRFSLLPYTSEHDLAIIRARRQPNVGIYQLCLQLFPLMIADLNGYSLAQCATRLDLNVNELISEMPVADALTIVANIRSFEVSEDMYFQGTCPYCGANNDDSPKKGLSHKLSGIDVHYIETLKAEPVISITLLTGVTIDCYPLQLAQFEEFCASEIPLDLRQVFYSAIASDDGTYDRDRDGLMDETIFVKLVTNITDRNLLIRSVDHLYQLGPLIEIGTDCVKCKQDWELDLAVSQLPEFFANLFFTPTETDLDNIFFYMTFGEQAPCKSIAEAKQMPTKERDRLVTKIAEAYKRQQEESKKGGKGKHNTTEYV